MGNPKGSQPGDSHRAELRPGDCVPCTVANALVRAIDSLRMSQQWSSRLPELVRTSHIRTYAWQVQGLSTQWDQVRRAGVPHRCPEMTGVRT